MRMPSKLMMMALGMMAALPLSAVEAQVGMVGPRIDARTIRVSGFGEYRIPPDIATVQLAVETTGATAQAAAAANADAMDRVITALIAAGVPREGVQTSGFSLFPEYADDRRPEAELEPPRIRGYRAMNQVSARTEELEQVGALIDAGLAAGANRMHGVYFAIEDAAAAEAEALSRAVADARAAAETIARTLGVQLGPVLDATTAAQPIQPMYRSRGDMAMIESVMAPVGAPTPIEPGQQTVTATASIVYGIE